MHEYPWLENRGLFKSPPIFPSLEETRYLPLKPTRQAQ